ncbi:Transglycosylase associated protein [Aedoeadaptatus ivorii]|uniref:Transglycosylase associated protein n=1 Tax=Aedoeadaptatus ivorii TaxID=54006 RepID=A0A3S4YJV0_9FIRM|nr:GlsB/YeaQ/YmgE family stress response membrane protein [Peptoniphilus ivorii]MDQ0508545.1 putative membrane protein YeaQ/YmgE (transglycosylase-associated protein family) [Peptoniphilus ivorii]VEJ34383.1 Transglycosylase associated protein [Peptoniphilus ivorii]
MLFWLIFGALTGWIASMIVGKDAQMGAIANIITGIVGSFIGGWIASNFLGLGKVSGFNLYSVLIGVAGSVILLLIVNAVTKRS